MVVWFQRIENAVVGVTCVVAYLQKGFDWWWLLVLFLLFDLSMLGYAVSPRIGAWTYNTVHSYVGPGILTVLAITVPHPHVLWFVLCLWVFHIAVDRAIGYGLKFTDGFQHTHLNELG